MLRRTLTVLRSSRFSHAVAAFAGRRQLYSTAPRPTLAAMSAAFATRPTRVHSSHVFDVLCPNAASAESAVAPVDSLPSQPPPAAAPAPFVLVLLNQPLDAFFLPLWQNATFRICADGAANRLYHFFPTDAERCRNLPHALMGDLDSIAPAVLDFYRTARALPNLPPASPPAMPATASPDPSPSDSPSPSPSDSPAAVSPVQPLPSCASAADGSVYVRRVSEQDTTDLHKCVEFVRHSLRFVRQCGLHAFDGERSSNDSATHPPPSFAEFPPPVCASDGDCEVEEWNRDALWHHLRLLAPYACPSAASSLLSNGAPSLVPSASGAEEATLPLLVYPAFGGRFDQQMAHVHMALEFESESEQQREQAKQETSSSDAPCRLGPLILLSRGNSARVLLPSHRHVLHMHPRLELGQHAGLWPVSAPALVGTSGLRWNLGGDSDSGAGQRMEWGGLISTSNRVQESIVIVETDQPLVWNTELKPRSNKAQNAGQAEAQIAATTSSSDEE